MTPRQRSRRAREAAQHRAWTDRLVRTWEECSPSDKAEGLRWYQTAEAEASRIAALAPHGVGPIRAAAVIAAFSPRVRWNVNVRAAEAACIAADAVATDPFAAELSGGREEAIRAAVSAACSADIFEANIAKASRILSGEHPDKVLGGPKVTAFFANITGDHRRVTVDVWAARAAFGGYAPVPQGRLYDRLQRAYQAAADRCGVSPRDFQAAIWIHVRGAAS